MSKYLKFELALLLTLATLSGCVVHKDFLTTFKIEGQVLQPSDQGLDTSTASIQLLDTKMDDFRSKRHFVFASFQTPLETYFSHEERYFWGSSSRSYAEAEITIIISKKQCSDAHFVFRLADLPRQGRVLLVDLRSVALSCDADSKIKL